MIKNHLKTVAFVCIMSLFMMSCSSSDGDIDPININPIVLPDPTPVAQKTVHSVITFDNPGKLIDVFFYDIKYEAKNIKTAAEATEIFDIDDSNGLRIPILGTHVAEAHPSAGVVVESMYSKVLTSINLAKQVRGAKKTLIFASKKLEGQNSFPDWVKDVNGVVPEKYAILLADFIEFMISKGVQIDYLAIDNEFVYNEGNITPSKYAQTISSLRTLALNRGFEMPILVGYEDFGPNKQDWIKTLLNNGWGNTMAVYGTHYYPNYRPKSKLIADLALVGNRPFWSTEPHWDAKTAGNDFDEAEEAICALWDQTDVGMTGFMWWAYDFSNSNIRSKLLRAVSVPLLGARPIKITDIDGEDISTLGKLQTRAFIEGKTITVYAVNMNETQRDDYTFKLEGSTIEGKISSIQWTESSSINGVVKLIDVDGDDKNIFSLSLPKRSISRFVFTIK